MQNTQQSLEVELVLLTQRCSIMKKTPTVAVLLFWLFSSSGGEDIQTSESLCAPEISLIPSWRILLRGNATVVCKASFSPIYFYLEKNAQNLTIPTETINGDAHFPITNMSTEHGGMYKCCYYSSGLSLSKCSEPLELLITDPDLPRPNISLTPRKMIHLGITITIQCSAKGPIQGFYLYKDGHKLEFQSVKSHEDNVTFSITDVKQSHGGRYCCSYKSPSYPFISESSNEVEMFVVEPRFPRPTISPSPIMLVAPGGNITIQCESKEPSMRFYLQKSDDEMPQQSLETNGTMVKFHIMNANESHTGEYSCRYSTASEPFIVSKISNLTRLVMTDPHLLKPSISLIPYEIAQLTSNIHIECVTNRPGNLFYLYKGREKKQLQIVMTEGDTVTFPINNLGKEDGGSFYCSYMNQSEFFTSSETSDNVTLFVSDPSLPKPNIFPKNVVWVALGRNINISCQSQYLSAKFFLQKDNDRMPHQILEVEGTMATFIISNATLAHRGKYKCSYSNPSHPFAISLPSDFVTIQITDPALPKPNISLSPSGMAILGSNITILCQVHDLNNTFHPNSTFYLYKAGDKDEPQDVMPDNHTAYFPISAVKKTHGGRYHCNYRPPLGSLMSQSSDPLEILLLDLTLTKPTISKSGDAVIRENITILCAVNNGPINFYLHTNGSPTPSHAMNTSFDRGEFSISNISWEHSGNYSCSYEFVSDPLVYSQPSDSLQVLVSEKPDYTIENIIHCAIGVLILLLLGYLMMLDCRFTKVYEIKSQQCSRGESLGESTLSPAPDPNPVPDPAPDPAPASPTDQELTDL